MDVRFPQRPTRPQVMGDEDDSKRVNSLNAIGETYNPSENVQNLLNSIRDRDHRARRLFSELDVLKPRGGELTGYEWRETARWVKYEEILEEGGKRWSKPHVASLAMYSLFELRNLIKNGTLLLDIEAMSISQAMEQVLDAWVDCGSLDEMMRNHVRDVLLLNHKFAHSHRPKDLEHSSDTLLNMRRASMISLSGSSGSGGHMDRNMSVDSFQNFEQNLDSLYEEGGDATLYTAKPNTRFMRKIPKGAHVANVMVGEMEDLDKPCMALVRLREARILGELTEVSLPTKFMFILIGPKGHEHSYYEVGRCISTMMVDEIFREVAYKSGGVSDILAGVDEFIQQVTVLPPAEWDPKIRIEPPMKVPSQDFRKSPSGVGLDQGSQPIAPTKEEEPEDHGDPTLVLTCVPFKGLYNDIKRKIPWYVSDYKDAAHLQAIASIVYIFLATLTPNVTFGGLLGQATNQYMGVMECIVAAAVTGVLFALFSGQPLNILGSTGPMLVLEMILFNFCDDYGWEYMPFRFWIGMWTCLMILLIVMWDLSALVRYITRFTEESFATLIAVIFIVEAFKKLFEIDSEAPVHYNPPDNAPDMLPACACNPPNITANITGDFSTTTMFTTTLSYNETVLDMISHNYYNIVNYLDVQNIQDAMTNPDFRVAVDTIQEQCTDAEGVWSCEENQHVPDVFFLSVILYTGTFALSVAFKGFKTTNFLPSSVRQIVSDFAVLLAIVAMVLVDYFMGVPTPKLIVPDEFKPTADDKRGWIVKIISEDNPWWLYLVAAAPAALSTILIFMDQQITAVIVNRKENKLRKGNGYHLDMFVLMFCVAIHSLFGLPWYVAATVSAIAHIQSLRKESECTAPGEKPVFLGVRENRLTALTVAVLSGLAVLLTKVLKIIPMPVLYGVFFYMGYAALNGMQFINRIFLIFMPMKYQPDYPFLRHVKLWKVHMLTAIQVACLAILWVIKAIKSISIGFPLMVLAIAVVRKLLDWVYTQNELKWIDDLLPGGHQTKKEKLEEKTLPYEPQNNGMKWGHLNRAFVGKDIEEEEETKAPAKSGNGVGNGKPAFFVGSEVDTHM